MCGITGFLGKNKDSPNNHQIKNCLNLMYNRGPDARGKIVKKFKNKSLIFLHSRLSIIDLSNNANQPFEDDNGILIFNGEIYNYLELKKICKKKKLILKPIQIQRYFLKC